MKGFIYLAIIVSFISCNKNGTPKPDQSGLYVKFFGGAFDDQGFSLTESEDGGYFLTGSTMLPNREDTSILVVKINSNGNKEWERKVDFGDIYSEIATDVVVGANGDVVVAGYKENPAGYFDFLLVRIKATNPDEFDTYTFGDSLRDERAFNLVSSPDGSYIVYGTAASGTVSDPTSDMYLLKTNLTDTVWVRQIGIASREDQIGKLYFTTGNQLIWCGTAHRIDGADMRMVFADQFGNLIWDYGYEDNDAMNQFGYDLEVLSDGYLLAGSKNRTLGSDAKDIYLVRTDFNGSKSDQYVSEIVLSEASSQEAYSVISDGSGNFVLTGYATSDKGDKDIYVAKIDANGSVIKSQKFGGAGEDVGRKIVKASNGYIVIGSVYAGNNKMVGVYKMNEELELVE